MGIPLTQARILLKQDGSLIKGAYSKETKDIYVVDNFNTTTGDAVNTVGNEVSHYIDDMREGDAVYAQTKEYRDNRDKYSDIMGDALEDYTSFTFAMNGYDSLTAVNQNSGTRNALGRPTDLIQRNNTVFDSLDPNQIEHRQFNYNEAKILDQARFKIKNLNLSPDAQQLTVALLEASGCAKVRCVVNVPKGDPRYKQLKQLQDFGDTLAEDSFDSLMAQLGVDTKYNVKITGQASRNGRTRRKQGFKYAAGDTIADFAQAKTGDTIEAAQEIVQGGYEFAVFAGAETVKNIYSTETTEGFAKYMAEQVNKTWVDAETSSIGQTNIDSMQTSTWRPGQNTLAELALLGIEVAPLLKPAAGVVKVVRGRKKFGASGELENIINKKLIGPKLTTRTALTFENKIYTNKKLVIDTKFYKYHGVDNRTGKKISWLTDKKYATERELRKGLAIRDDWGVKIDRVTEFNVRKGSWVSEGKAASQGENYPGGGYQAVIQNLSKSQIVRTDKVFQ